MFAGLLRTFDCGDRTILGGAIGCVQLYFGQLIVVHPFYPPISSKGDERWETVTLVAACGLPAAFGLGAFAALMMWRSRTMRLSPFQFAGCCFVIAFVSALLRPHISRIRDGGRGLLYEVVPDLMSNCFALFAAAGIAWAVVRSAMKLVYTPSHDPE